MPSPGPNLEMPFAKLLGLIVTRKDKDHVTAKMLIRPELCTAGGFVHGGALMAFADSVGAIATVLNLPEGAQGTTTIESKTNFVRSAKPGETIVSEFDLARAFRSYFGKQTPGISGIAFGVDTSRAGSGGKGAAFIKSIEFFNGPP